ncbi:ArnT family glycosyltransferase [Maribacter sp. 2307ULW6-5]|uniref:ArnT family glycosyltransferase n=1 Tax=Maribacter sp. 2307ULW6-5 TaxID=3386275 RepID=UPI0039BC373E
MISDRRYWFFMLMAFLVYLAGITVTLFENDSAQFAVMAMRMVQEGDFLNLFKGPEEYLDKPHMHYWLAAISFKIFGLHDWAYRIPGILATLFAAYSCHGLGSLLYGRTTGKLAALIFMTAQTIVLGAIDVRTDAVLTGFAIFSLWQLTAYVQTGAVKAIVLGALGAGLAFSTKGQIALVVIGLPLLCHMAYANMWRRFLSWKVLLALAVFLLATAPMLYAYYHQFDLHPEKVIRGRSDRSGIFFIFWEQSFERLSGEGMGTNSGDYLFFFHTFLWVFLPWTLVGIAAYASRVKELVKSRMARRPKTEFLTVGGITLIFFLISFAQFKLPHYLNITMPLFAVLTAAFLTEMQEGQHLDRQRVLLWLQGALLGIVVLAGGFLCFYVFQIQGWGLGALLVMGLMGTGYLLLKKEHPLKRLLSMAVCASFLLNLVLNLHFYPKLLQYQGGSEMAKVVRDRDIPTDRIYKISGYHTWALDFYNKMPVKRIDLQTAGQMSGIWLYVNDDELAALEKAGLQWDAQHTVNQFRITRLQAKFLNPATRRDVVRKMHLVQLP